MFTKQPSRPILKGVRPRRVPLVLPSVLWLLWSAIQLTPTSAKAERTHTVQVGQSLAYIAKLYGVTTWSLAAANALSPESTVRAGQVLQVPEKGVVYVNAGQTLWSVARRHGCTVDELARVNGLTTSSNLRPGMRLVLPGYQPGPKGQKGSKSKSASSALSAQQNAMDKPWGPPGRSSRLKLYRIATNQELTITVTDQRGRVRPAARRQLAQFLRPRDSKKTKLPDPRLLGLLAQVSDHFGGRKIHVISGYRLAGGRTSQESRHTAAAAIDFRIEGVSTRTLRDYLRHFKNVGVGYYPNSNFVHFDVRPTNAYWVDLSRPGQRAAYVPREIREGFDGPTTGLAELGKQIGATLAELDHEEPDHAHSNDE
jgi:uncharacterized protein YcbK (DUF882 family)